MELSESAQLGTTYQSGNLLLRKDLIFGLLISIDGGDDWYAYKDFSSEQKRLVRSAVGSDPLNPFAHLL